jgi:hypothetical protein
MSSLLPEPLGCGTRNNGSKRAYILEHLGSIEYRTLACESHDEAVEEEGELRKGRDRYLFPT